jgi:hypothetical protein
MEVVIDPHSSSFRWASSCCCDGRWGVLAAGFHCVHVGVPRSARPPDWTPRIVTVPWEDSAALFAARQLCHCCRVTFVGLDEALGWDYAPREITVSVVQLYRIQGFVQGFRRHTSYA